MIFRRFEILQHEFFLSRYLRPLLYFPVKLWIFFFLMSALHISCWVYSKVLEFITASPMIGLLYCVLSTLCHVLSLSISAAPVVSPLSEQLTGALHAMGLVDIISSSHAWIAHFLVSFYGLERVYSDPRVDQEPESVCSSSPSLT